MNCFFFNDTATTEIYTLSLHDALPIYERATARHQEHVRVVLVGPLLAEVRRDAGRRVEDLDVAVHRVAVLARSEEHTSELQSRNISYAVFCLKQKTHYLPSRSLLLLTS